MKLKKLISLALGTALTLSLAACGGNNTTTADGNTSDKLQPPSPFVDCKTLAEAIEMSGIEITVPEAIEGYDDCTFRANKTDDLIEVIYQNDDNEIRFRKGLSNEDISGNYNDFVEKNDVDVDGITVQMKGSGGKVNLASWSTDDYSYSIDSTKPMEKTAMSDFVKIVNDENVLIGGDPSTWGPDIENDDSGLQPPSPFVDCDSMDDAAAIAGFDMTLPKAADALQAWEGNMIQAFYGEDGADMLIRKGPGSENISGDYNEYAQIETVDSVTLKGADGLFSLALWTDGEYTYSVSVGAALSQADMMALVTGVK